MKSESKQTKRAEETSSAPSVGLFNSFSSPNTLHTLTAVIELGAGSALLCFPSATTMLLIGVLLLDAAALTVARVAGVALLTLGAANWLARGDSQSRAARGLAAAMVFYNLGVVFIFGAAGIWSQLFGIALWPAVALHAAMTVWCMMSLLSGQPEMKTRSSEG